MGSGDRQEQVLAALRGIFGDRLKGCPAPGGDHVLATVSPRDAEEVGRLAVVAGRLSLPLVALGAGTLPSEEGGNDGVLVRFDLMGATRLPDGDERWVEAGPGATLLSLENSLETRGLGLALYPTSAPRATVGGWLAAGGLGVGSFEYGRLPENVLSADVVLAGGERKTVPGEQLPGVLRGNPGGLMVGARLRTRRARDTPFAVRFGDPAGLAGAVAGLVQKNVPLWHLAFLNGAMSRARRLGEEALLFGAYPEERSAAVEEVLLGEVSGHGGRALPPADAYRVWGERFFPVAPSRPTPTAEREVVPLAQLGDLDRGTDPVQATVGRDGEVLLLTLREGGRNLSR